uniref:Reverse transcriptase domain-containing protein n=1 Tax=Tanacetum cinerariifolium TaxID=118510 RepID=A0A6L2KQ93_TANCI|nr:hypothetical protein [Tanacetum cinerariifolium]
MAPKRTSTSAAPAMTQAAIRKLIADSVTAALKAQAATMENTNHINRNTGPSETPVARKETNDHKRKFNDRRNTTNNDNDNYPNNHDNDNYPNDRNNNNHCNNRNNNKYQDNRKNNNRNNDYYQQQNKRQENAKTYAATPTKNKRMAPKRTSTYAAPAMTQAAIRQLIADSVAAALEAQVATIENTNHTNRNTGPSETPVARKGTIDHKRKFNDRRNTTNNDYDNSPNNRDNNNYPNDRNNNNHCNNREVCGRTNGDYGSRS